jgi:hypothetical protein
VEHAIHHQDQDHSTGSFLMNLDPWLSISAAQVAAGSILEVGRRALLLAYATPSSWETTPLPYVGPVLLGVGAVGTMVVAGFNAAARGEQNRIRIKLQTLEDRYNDSEKEVSKVKEERRDDRIHHEMELAHLRDQLRDEKRDYELALAKLELARDSALHEMEILRYGVQRADANAYAKQAQETRAAVIMIQKGADEPPTKLPGELPPAPLSVDPDEGTGDAHGTDGGPQPA